MQPCHRWPAFTLGVALSGLPIGGVRGQCEVGEDQRLAASDGSSSDSFGFSAGVSGDCIAVGAFLADGATAHTGAAYVFRWNGGAWVEEQKLFASDGANRDHFGVSVAIDGDVVVCGAPERSDLQGVAYVFRRTGNGWVEEQRLTPSGDPPHARFGSDVDVCGDVIVIGAPGFDDRGAAYVFRYDGTTWGHEATLTDPNGSRDDSLGISVAVEPDVALVGAYLGDGQQADSGIALVFRRDIGGWQLEQELSASDGASGDSFGVGVGLDGSRAVIGAPTHDQSGAAYVFRRDFAGTWVEDAQLQRRGDMQGDFFADEVDICGERVIASTFAADSLAGRAALFRDTGAGWVEQNQFVASDRHPDDFFGTSVGLSEDTVICGAYRAGGGFQGAAYVRRVGDLTLAASPAEPQVGEFLSLCSCGGTPFFGVIGFVVELNDVPVWRFFDRSSFDSEGAWSTGGTVPPDLAGAEVSLQTFGYVDPSRIGASRIVRVVIH